MGARKWLSFRKNRYRCEESGDTNNRWLQETPPSEMDLDLRHYVGFRRELLDAAMLDRPNKCKIPLVSLLKCLCND